MENRPREDQDHGHGEGRGESHDEGQVSEVGGFGDAGEKVPPSDAVAGHPSDDDVQEGATGPDARTGDQDREDR